MCHMQGLLLEPSFNIRRAGEHFIPETWHGCYPREDNLTMTSKKVVQIVITINNVYYKFFMKVKLIISLWLIVDSDKISHMLCHKSQQKYSARTSDECYSLLFLLFIAILDNLR